jgi:transketolase
MRDGIERRLADRARFVRSETIRLTAQAGAGHLGSTLGDADLLSVLFYHAMRIDPKRPDWPARDRFVLSKGHVAIGLYPILADLGFFPASTLDDYGTVGHLADHPDMRITPGIDFSSGSLGHGLSIAIGMALAARLDGLDNLVFCLLGDGELAEGQVWEALMAGAHLRLANLVAIVDRNGLTLDGPTEDVMQLEPLESRLQAFGWDCRVVDGHDIAALVATFDRLRAARSAPAAVLVRTIKGKGVDFMEDAPAWHLGGLSADDAVRAISRLG